jgi:outer membrane protein assembly factor BamD (BamD/ComL family)
LGDYYMARGDWSNAQARYSEALRIQQSVLGENRAVAVSMIALSKALKKLHLKDQARNLMARAKTILSSHTDPLQQATVDVMALRRQ